MLNLNILRAIAVFAVFFTCLFAFSCGKSKPVSPSSELQVVKHSGYVEWNDRHVKPLNELLNELDSLQLPSGVDPQEWAGLKERMRAWLNATFGEGKSASKYPLPPASPPTHDYVKARNLAWGPEDGNVWGKLTWRYVNDGDYNEDGNVGVSEISQLAMHLHEAVSGPNTIQELIDEDAEGGLLDGDLIVDAEPPNQMGFNNDERTLHLNFGVDVASYEILGSVDGSTWVPDVGEVLFSERLDPSDERDVFEWSIPNGTYKYYKVIALSFDGEPWHSDSGLTQVVQSDACAVPPPTITNVSPIRVHPGVQVEFSAYLNSFPGTITNYDWQFNVRGVPYYFNAANPEITFPVTEDQSYDVYAQVRVSSQFGYSYPRPYYYFTITVTKDGIPPSIVSVTPPSVDGEDGEQVSFEADVDGDQPFTYAWDFDDGATPNTSSSATPTVNLANPGEHLARLTVTNAYGSAFVNIPLTVHGWITTPIDTSGNLNYGTTPFISLAHSNCGESGISYQTDSMNLKYARRIEGEWLEPEDVDLFVEDLLNGIRIYVGTNNSLAFNPSPLDPETAEPSIAYEYRIEEWDEINQVWTGVSGAGGVRYASWSSNGWIVQDGVVVNADGADPSLAFHDTTPYVSWYHDFTNCDLYLSHETYPLPWDSLIIDNGVPISGTGLDSSLAIDSSGNWYIAYRAVVMTPDPPPPAPPTPNPVELRLARNTYMAGEPIVVDSITSHEAGAGIAFSNSIALTPGGKAWIAYLGSIDNWTPFLRVAREPMGTGPWPKDTIDIEDGNPSTPSLDISEGGVAGLAYCWYGGNSVRALKYLENINGSWEEPVTFDVNASACSFSFTPEGKPSIAYVADGNLYYTELF